MEERREDGMKEAENREKTKGGEEIRRVRKVSERATPFLVF